MTRYSQALRDADQAFLKHGLARLRRALTDYEDLLVIPEIITIEDVCNIALDTTQGPQRVGDVCSRDEIIHILRAFQDNACGDPVLVAQYALNDYRDTHTPTSSKES